MPVSGKLERDIRRFFGEGVEVIVLNSVEDREAYVLMESLTRDHFSLVEPLRWNGVRSIYGPTKEITRGGRAVAIRTHVGGGIHDRSRRLYYWVVSPGLWEGLV